MGGLIESTYVAVLILHAIRCLYIVGVNDVGRVENSVKSNR